MSTRVVDRFGYPYSTREVRKRMGFMPDELDANDGEPVSFQSPAFDMPGLRETSEDGGFMPPLCKGKR